MTNQARTPMTMSPVVPSRSARTTPGRPLVALCTSVDWRHLSPDDRVLVPALERAGVDSRIVVWTDDAVAWEDFDLIVVRSCWDYHDDLPRWFSWLDALEGRGLGERLCNSPSVMRWNARKTYLAQLGARGVPTVPTRWLTEADLQSWSTLRSALENSPWPDFICKPAVSAGAIGTLRLDRDALSSPSTRQILMAAHPILESRAPVLVQPFLQEITAGGPDGDAWGGAGGEWSLLFFDGRFSHAVRKRPARADFRVQEKHGGSTEAAVPPDALQETAAQVLSGAACAMGIDGPSALLYARVDLVVTGGQPVLMELELIEPALFLTAASDAREITAHVAGFCEAIARRARAHRSHAIGT